AEFELRAIEIPEKGIESKMIYVHDDRGAAFFVDPHVTTLADMHRMAIATNGLHGVKSETLTFLAACNYAEESGMRLPTNDEWERAQCVLPVRAAGDLAEWTSTQQLIPDNEGELMLRDLRYSECRIVRGGSFAVLAGRMIGLLPQDYAANNSLPIPA